MRCGRCRTVIAPGANYCPRCGEPLIGEEEPHGGARTRRGFHPRPINVAGLVLFLLLLFLIIGYLRSSGGGGGGSSTASQQARLRAVQTCLAATKALNGVSTRTSTAAEANAALDDARTAASQAAAGDPLQFATTYLTTIELARQDLNQGRASDGAYLMSQKCPQIKLGP